MTYFANNTNLAYGPHKTKILIFWLLCIERVSNQLIRPTRQWTFRREVDKFRAVGYRPVYKLTTVQSCPRADSMSLFVLI